MFSFKFKILSFEWKFLGYNRNFTIDFEQSNKNSRIKFLRFKLKLQHIKLKFQDQSQRVNNKVNLPVSWQL